MKLRFFLCTSVAVVCTFWASTTFAQTATPGVTGSGDATFTAATSYGGVALTSLDFGTGVEIPGDTSATGHFHVTLVGTGRAITVDGRVSAGSTFADGSATFSGTCTVDIGDGSLLRGVVFTVVAVPNAQARGTLTLTLGTSKLAAAAIQVGTLTIRR
jgi:hypothetical protein